MTMTKFCFGKMICSWKGRKKWQYVTSQYSTYGNVAIIWYDDSSITVISYHGTSDSQRQYILHTCRYFLWFKMETFNADSILTADRHILCCTVTFKPFCDIWIKCFGVFFNFQLELVFIWRQTLRQVVQLWAAVWIDLTGCKFKQENRAKLY